LRGGSRRVRRAAPALRAAARLASQAERAILRGKPASGEPAMSQIYEFKADTLQGEEIALSDYKGQVLLIVNTASKCGFTPQYEGLEALHGELAEKGLAVLGFPCNQFGKQEPGDAEEIANFCKLTYDVSFPMFAKIDVNGPKAAPLYEYLKGEAKGLMGSKSIKWNFTKFLVDREGNVVKRFGPKDKPENLKAEIEALL
jgi:glutathione peroxidase